MSRASDKPLNRREAVIGLGAAALATGACQRLWPGRGQPAPARTREVVQVVDAQPHVEGAGVHLRRALGSQALAMLDPFLMLDEFHSDKPEDYELGFPSHPH